MNFYRNSIMNDKKRWIKDPNTFIVKLLRKFPFLSSDKYYLKMKYKNVFGNTLNLKDPVTFNEKIQWLKLYYKNPLLTKMVDKVEVKRYVADKIGEEYIIPTLGVWNSFDEIEFKKLPNQFVLKTNHDYGGVVICTNKNNFDYHKAKEKLTKHLKRNFYYVGREWAYKNVKPQILAEEYVGKLGDDDVKDYKFYCFNGEPKILLISSGRQKDGDKMKWNFYDMDFNLLSLAKSNILPDANMTKPINFHSMLKLARALSEEFPFVRTDFYNIEGEIYFGELTFYPGAGYGRFEPEEWDQELGSYIQLPEKQNFN